jgi:1,4-alpha-glucan branching enzyme
MSGDRWQRFANLRAYYAFMWTQPGKKLLFMGVEFAQESEWNHDIGLDWQLLSDPLHRGVQRLVRDLNLVYRSTPALHRLDCEPGGFSWIDVTNAAESVVAYQRRAAAQEPVAVVVCNFTPVVREAYRIGVPQGGRYRERINTDATDYGGSGVGNAGEVRAEAHPMHGLAHSIQLRLPPLGVLILTSEPG